MTKTCMPTPLPVLDSESATLAHRAQHPHTGAHASVYLVPLGCSKAQIDAEEMLGALVSNGYAIAESAESADAVLVNTCGFIQPAKEEAVEAILDAVALKQAGGPSRVIVTGCLAERYPDELRAEIPEADLVLPWTKERELIRHLDAMFGVDRQSPAEWGGRVLISPAHWAYVRISEGCDHRCSFCSIPSIRGRHVSLRPEEIEDEIRRLVDAGVQEINLVAQDTSMYGADLFGKPALPKLLDRLARIPDLRWLRLFYTHPAHVGDELIDTMNAHDNILPYLDLPIQHINDEMLKRMRRIVRRAKVEALISRFRERVPDLILRTSLIVGFPGETRKRFQELVDFLPQAQFDRLGCFTFSKEEGTEAAGLRSTVSEREKEERRAIIMDVQREISLARNALRIGRVYDVLVEESTASGGLGRSYGEAPEVDGMVEVVASEPLTKGTWVRAEITEAREHDLVARRADRVSAKQAPIPARTKDKS